VSFATTEVVGRAAVIAVLGVGLGSTLRKPHNEHLLTGKPQYLPEASRAGTYVQRHNRKFLEP
jgi:hypothetical protein